MSGFYSTRFRDNARLRGFASNLPLYLPPSTGTAWDPSSKGAEIVLTNGNIDAENATGVWRTVYGTTGRSSGKYAYEIVFLAGSAATRPFASVADKTNMANVQATYTGNSSFNTKESAGYWGNGNLYYYLSTSAPGFVAVPATAVNDIITVAIDFSVPEASFYKNGVHVHTLALPAGKTLFPASSLNGGGKVRLIPSGLTYLPAGFSEWG